MTALTVSILHAGCALRISRSVIGSCAELARRSGSAARPARPAWPAAIRIMSIFPEPHAKGLALRNRAGTDAGAHCSSHAGSSTPSPHPILRGLRASGASHGPSDFQFPISCVTQSGSRRKELRHSNGTILFGQVVGLPGRPFIGLGCDLLRRRRRGTGGALDGAPRSPLLYSTG